MGAGVGGAASPSAKKRGRTKTPQEVVDAAVNKAACETKKAQKAQEVADRKVARALCILI